MIFANHDLEIINHTEVNIAGLIDHLNELRRRGYANVEVSASIERENEVNTVVLSPRI